MSKKYIDGGYILLSRKLIESEIWQKPPMYLKVWVYILSKAQHKPYKNLDRGELLVTIPELIEVCSHKVGYRTERPTKSQIYNILEWLRNSHEGVDEDGANSTMIDTTKTTRGMVLKVRSYNVYQDSSNYERNAEHNDEDSTTATMRQRQADTINKNVKNEKNVKEDKPSVDYDFEFEEFYKIYKKKEDRKRAFGKFKVARKKHSFETIMKGTESYMNNCEKNGTEKKYIKGAAVFLNGENFLDEYEDIDTPSHVYNKPQDTVIDINAGEDW